VIHYHLLAPLAAQRREELGADMQAARWPGPGRPWRGTTAARRRARRRVADWLPGGNGWRSWPRSRANGRQTVLSDGSEVLIRPLRGTDAPLLADGFARLSLRSRHMRFLTPKAELSAAELHYLTEVDHHDHEALGAVDHADGRGVGVARYIRSADNVAVERLARNIGADLVEREHATVTYEISLVPGEEPDQVACVTCPVGETHREATRVFQRPSG